MRRTRSRYKEIGGSIVEVGKEYTTRKEKSRERAEGKRKATGVLKSIMVRLMPHEAEMAGSLKESQIAEAVDSVAKAYQDATGCEVISAAVHRMTGTDLHIHLQYCMVQARREREREFARRVAAWKRRLTGMAREALKNEGHSNPGPVKVSNKKKQLLQESAIEPMPERGMVWQKVVGKRSMRDDSILGYSLRQKLNLVRAAEACGEHELARKVALKNDYRCLCMPIARMDDEKLNARYRDLWLERVWRNAVVSLLPSPQKTLAKLKKLGLEAARKYDAYGTTQVEATHLDRRAKELKQLARDLKKEQIELEATAQELQKREQQMDDRLAALADGNDLLNEDRSAIQKERLELSQSRDETIKVENDLKKREDKLKHDHQTLQIEQGTLSRDRRVLDGDRSGLDKDRSELTNQQENLELLRKQIDSRESDLESRTAEIDERTKDLNHQEINLTAREKTICAIEKQNKDFELKFGQEVEKLVSEQKQLKADQVALEQEHANLGQIKKTAKAYRNLKEQVIVVLRLIVKVPEIAIQVVQKTPLGNAISKLAELVGTKISLPKDPDMGK